MKTKLLAILLSTGIGLTNAQEKQNDATWNETIEFLTDNLQYTAPVKGNFETFVECKIVNNDFLVQKKIQSTYYGEVNSCEFNYNLSFDKIDIIEVNSYANTDITPILFKLKGDLVKNIKSCKGSTWGRRNGEIEFTNNLSISFPNKDLANRMAQAFRHLVYLANEKRKQSKF